MEAAVLAVILGLAWGSFANVLLSRWPRREPWLLGRSKCPHCQHPLPWYDNLPLISFVLLRGRCRACGGAISWRYPAVEAAGGLLFLALWLRYAATPWLLCYFGPGAALLLILAAFDLENWWLPDRLLYPALVWGLGAALLFPPLDFRAALLGAGSGAAFLTLVRGAYQLLTRREGLGWGDVKLLAVIGAYSGLEALPLILLLSSSLGILAGVIWSRRLGLGRLTPVPYGFFLALSAIFYFLGADYLRHWGLVPNLEGA